MGDRNEYKRRQKLMHDAGFATKTDGSWGSWHENLWLNYLKDKHPVTTFIADNIAQPIANGIGTILGNAVESGKPIQDAAKKGEYHRLPLTTINGAAGIGFSPISSVMGLIPGSLYLGYLDPTHTRALFNMNKLINDPNYKYLELDYSDISPTLNDALITASYLEGGWGANRLRKAKSNYSQLGRYTLDTLYPASYPLKFFYPNKEGSIARRLIGSLLSLPIRPLLYDAPLFTNGKRPRWYKKYVKNLDEESAYARFLNGEKWAGIEDVPTSEMYIPNGDGTYRLTPKYLEEKSGIDFDPSDARPIDEHRVKSVMPDFFTKSGIGGEHSDFIMDDRVTHYNSNNHKEKYGDFVDELKLNPQWFISSFLKKPLRNHLGNKKVAAIYNWLDRMGGKNISGIIGYKPFTIKLPIKYVFENANGDATIRPLFPGLPEVLTVIQPKAKTKISDLSNIPYAEYEEIQ